MSVDLGHPAGDPSLRDSAATGPARENLKTLVDRQCSNLSTGDLLLVTPKRLLVAQFAFHWGRSASLRQSHGEEKAIDL